MFSKLDYVGAVLAAVMTLGPLAMAPAYGPYGGATPPATLISPAPAN